MKLILHICRKDLRHHRLAAFVSLAILVIFVWDQPRHWTNHSVEFSLLSNVLRYLPLFLIIAWLFFLVRVVHEQSLVGDRQFWVTRPYSWHKLLAAKVLAAIVVVHLPLFFAQLLLLKLAFFPILPSLLGLAQVQLMLVFSLTLPALVVGSVTRGIGQATLVALGIFLAIVGLASLTFVFPNLDFTPDTFDNIEMIIVLAACLSVLIIQFKYRFARLSWCIIGVSAVSVVGLLLLSASETVQKRSMPLPTAAHPLPAKFSFDQGVSFRHAPGDDLDPLGLDATIDLPFLVEDLPENSLVQIRGIKLDLDLPTGDRWTSYWHSDSEILIPGRTRFWPSTQLKRSVFNQIRNSSANAHLSLDLNVYRLGPASSVSLRGDSLHLPADTRCARAQSPSRLRCFSALQGPPSFVLYADLPSAGCRTPVDGPPEPWAAAPAFYASLAESSGPDLDFTPIHEDSISLSRRHVYEDIGAEVVLCAGTPLALASAKFQYTVRAEIGLGNIRISNYVPSYPREITPKIPRTPSRNPSDTLSFNFSSLSPISRRNR